MLIDTHAHLYWDSYKQDFSGVIQRCIENSITTIINIGVDVEKSKLAVLLDPGKIRMTFYSTIGIHPHEADKYRVKGDGSRGKLEEDIQKLEEIYHKNPKKVIGVGECGLDFFRLQETVPQRSEDDFFREEDSGRASLARMTFEQLKELQRKLFKSQIDLAKKLDLPLIVHCRDDRSKDSQNAEAWMECLEMIKDSKGILHCYSGTAEVTKKALELKNFLISFAGNITYPKNEYLREAAKIIPLERICLETDCPFLAPQSIRGKRNEPSSVKEIAQIIAELKGISFEEVANQTTANVKKLFNSII